MVFSSWIVAPRAASSLVSICFSSRVTGGMGAGSRAEPPPVEAARVLGRREPGRTPGSGLRQWSYSAPLWTWSEVVPLTGVLQIPEDARRAANIYSSVGECLPSQCEALNSILSTKKKLYTFLKHGISKSKKKTANNQIEFCGGWKLSLWSPGDTVAYSNIFQRF